MHLILAPNFEADDIRSLIVEDRVVQREILQVFFDLQLLILRDQEILVFRLHKQVVLLLVDFVDDSELIEVLLIERQRVGL